jgi:hypothetical protein
VIRASAPALRALAVVVLPVAILAACSADPVPTPSRQPLATAPGASATLSPPASFGPPPSPTPDDATPLVLDATLLAYLPTSVGGVDVTEDVDEAATALSDPALPRIASGVDGAVAVDGNGNLVYGWIVRLRPDVFTDADYRQWRDAYDEGACAAAGGVVGRAEATIAERKVYVTSCVAGLHTYHLWLQDQDILIAASSIGEARFGEKLLEGLRVPA